MPTPAHDKITNALKQLQAEGQFSARIITDFDDLSIDIKDFGPLKLPIKPTRAKALIKKARPAKYGLKEQTILDPQVRNVWEIPKSHIKIDKRRWNKTLNPTLLELNKKLGLQEGQQLKAQLHNFLIYEKGQFFQSHQDTEKTENMVATLVILLPSRYRGGTLLVENQGDRQSYPSTSAPENKLTFIAFYADCQHEVKPVTDGYRLALTYNLILEQSTQRDALSITRRTQQTLDKAVACYFKQSLETKNYRSPRCRKLVYLLDHDYTANGLNWNNLKSNDQIRAQALLNSASKNHLEVFLTLADVHESWSCESSYDGGYSRYGSRYNDWNDDEEDDTDWNNSDEDSVQLLDLIDDDTEIRHWLDSTGKKINYPSLFVWGNSICWTKANNECQPFEKEYEGYMGNWGDTMDYWYHRAAIVLWQELDHYNALLEFNPTKVIVELLARVKVLEKGQLTELVRNLLKDWSGLNHEAKAADYNQVLKLAIQINDEKLADALLEKLDNKAFTVSSVKQWIKLEKAYGVVWCINTLKNWHTDRSYQKKPVAIEQLDKIVNQFCLVKVSSVKESTPGELLNWMLMHQWQVLQVDNEFKLKNYQMACLLEQADEQIQDAGIFINALLTARNQVIHDSLIAYLLAHETLYPPVNLVKLLLSLQLNYQTQDASHWFYYQALQNLYERLLVQMRKGTRKSDDWSIMDNNRCSCHDCQDLNLFLQAKTTQKKIWPLNKDRRMHIHQTIESMRLTITHQTQRTGRPHKLILKKTKELFLRDKKYFEKTAKAVKKLSESGLIKVIT